MPIDPPADDGGLSFVWWCTRCPSVDFTLSWLSAARALRNHRADVHGLHTSEPLVGPRTVPCVDCGQPVAVQRERQPRCEEHQTLHARAAARARRQRAA